MGSLHPLIRDAAEFCAKGVAVKIFYSTFRQPQEWNYSFIYPLLALRQPVLNAYKRQAHDLIDLTLVPLTTC